MYLVIFFIAAGVGIGSLWLYQRHQRKLLNTVGDFRSSLERISTHSVTIPQKHIERRVSTRPGGRRRPEPLDPARREAARRRLERRRAARA